MSGGEHLSDAERQEFDPIFSSGEDQAIPIQLEERARFVTRRFVDYRDALYRGAGILHEHPEPVSDKAKVLAARLSNLADRIAFEDLQAVLGRRGPVAMRIELAVRRAEAQK